LRYRVEPQGIRQVWSEPAPKKSAALPSNICDCVVLLQPMKDSRGGDTITKPSAVHSRLVRNWNEASKLKRILTIAILPLCILSGSCSKPAVRLQRTHDRDQDYIEILERMERAGNRYRAAIDLLKYSSSTLERSLSDSHLQLTRSVLESEFQLAEIDSQYLGLNQAPSISPSSSQAGPSQYDTAAAEVWRIYNEVEEANKKLEAARQALRKATTPEGFRKNQQAVDRAQKELEVANKKLDLSGSNLDIEEYQRKKESPDTEIHSLAEHLKELREELIPSLPKSNGSPMSSPKVAEEARSSPPASSGSGIVGSFREYLLKHNEVGTLNQALTESNQLLAAIRSRLTERSQLLESLQIQHMELNKRVQAAYNRIYELLKTEGAAATTGLLQETDQQMAISAHFDQKKELTDRAIATIRRQANLLQEDNEKLGSWVEVSRQERNQSLSRVATRLGIVLALICAILLIAYYLKKLSYKFVKESKNVYYLRKIIGFFSGLMIVVIILLNFVADFGGISAVIGLAGAGLAIALQDPIVCLVGWFLIIGKAGITVGDRVEINNVKGDVIDIGLLRTAVLEIGNWVSAEQSTGRVVFFPNSFIFKNHFFNYSTGNSLIWDEVQITVTYESDWKRAQQIIENVAEPICKEFVERAKASQAAVSRRFHINLGTLTPYVYVTIAEKGVELVLRYLTEIRHRRSSRDQICREVLGAFDSEPQIDLASPIHRNPTETRGLSSPAASTALPVQPNEGTRD
jgi:small-conductance mechanosensitive channel